MSEVKLTKALSTGETDLQKYLSAISKIKMLTQEEEQSLAIDVVKNNTVESAHALVVSHLPLVVKLAYSYKNYGLSVADLISEGNIGLIKAVSKFDPYKGFRLSTYAIWWIKAYMTDYIINSWSLVKSGTLYARKKLFFSLNKIKNKLGITHVALSDSDLKQISTEAGVTTRDVEEVNQMMHNRDVSLQTLVYHSAESEATLEDVIEDTRDNPEEYSSNRQEENYRKKLVNSALSILTKREQEVLHKRYVLDKPMTLEVIGKNMNISRERVRQIEVSALKKARDFLQDRNIESHL